MRPGGDIEWFEVFERMTEEDDGVRDRMGRGPARDASDCGLPARRIARGQGAVRGGMRSACDRDDGVVTLHGVEAGVSVADENGLVVRRSRALDLVPWAGRYWPARSVARHLPGS